MCAITRIPFLWALIHGKQTHNLRRLHKIYGDVVRIAPNELSYTNPSAWKDIYAHRQGKPEMGKYRVIYSEHPGADHIVIADRENHSRLRKNLSHGFSEASMRQQESLIQSYVDLLMRCLEQSSNDGQTPLNMCSWYNWTTFDIIGDLTFGEPFGCLESSTYHPWVSIIMDSIKLGAYMQALSYVPFGRKLAMLFVPKKLVAKKKAHHQMTIEKVKRRVELKEERADFLGGVLKRKDQGFTFPELVSNSSILIFAGSETTATALSAMTYYILKNPSSMATLVHEVRSAFSHNDEITINSVGNLKYMLACINETLRMFPPAAVGFSRVVPEGGDFIAGRWVPAGVSCTIPRTATLYGQELISSRRPS
jgi:cytochrome P450